MQGSQPAETKSKGKHTAKNIMALRGSERLRGWVKGEWIGKDARRRKETNRTNEKTRGKVEGSKARAGSQRMGKGRGCCRGCVYGCGYMYICI